MRLFRAKNKISPVQGNIVEGAAVQGGATSEASGLPSTVKQPTTTILLIGGKYEPLRKNPLYSVAAMDAYERKGLFLV